MCACVYITHGYGGGYLSEAVVRHVWEGLLPKELPHSMAGAQQVHQGHQGLRGEGEEERERE